MSIEVVPYTPEWEGAVLAFNRRMREGGTSWGWYERAGDEWIPPRPGQKVWREHYLAVEGGTEVRGAYALKPHEWWVNGEPMIVTDWQGPVSEGLLSRKYNTLGLRLLRDMLKRYPRLYSWGHGGEEAKMFQMLVSMKWLLVGTPFCLRVLRPHRFLRSNRYLRGSPRNRLALDALAWSGLGWLGLKALHAGLALRGGATGRGLDVEVVERFGSFADAVWERSHGSYRAVALRDAATLNATMPEGGWPPVIRLRMRRGGEDVGWAAVMDNALHDDARFGDLRVGSVVDGLARPEDAADVAAAATGFLADRGVDLLCSNQSHPAWVRGLEASGYLALANRRYFVASPELQKALGDAASARAGLHLTNLDGHGPHAL